MKYMGKSKLTAAALLVSAVLTSAAVAEPALSPSLAQGISGIKADANVQLVRGGDWRRGHHGGGWRHHGGGGRGWGWGAGAAAAGLLLTAPYWGGGEYAYDEGYDGEAYAEGGSSRCEATFRSYDPSSGTYVGYDGVRHRCPYL